MIDHEKPWLSEPDRLDWVDHDTGYPCAIRRGPMLSLYGYVGIPDEHPLYGQPYNAKIKPPAEWLERKGSIDQVGVMNIFLEAIGRKEDDDTYSIASLVQAHGGITYADHDVPLYPNGGASWWYGFDCAHAFDLVPGMVDVMKRFGRMFPVPASLTEPSWMQDTYRTIGFVHDICTGMATELHDLAVVTVVGSSARSAG